MAKAYIPDECSKCLKDETGSVKCPRSFRMADGSVFVNIPHAVEIGECPNENARKRTIILNHGKSRHEMMGIDVRLF